MTRADREHLARLLEDIAAKLDTASDRAEANAKADVAKSREKYPNTTETHYPYMSGALQAETKQGADRIRAAITAFLASKRATGRAA